MRRIPCLLLVAILWATTASAASPDNLDRYIGQKDASYQWRIIDEKPVTADVFYEEMILTSQTWHETKWNHRVKIYRPRKATGFDKAFLYITGGSWNDARERQREEQLQNGREARRNAPPPPPTTAKNSPFGFDEGMIATHVAGKLGLPFVILENVPLQPIFGDKTEDTAIAYTFSKFIETSEYDWPLLLPMTKSAVRAMDALQEFAEKQWKTPLKGFVVSGASKRGWTTWLTAASDKRVIACVPAVIDVLNMQQQMKHQIEMLGHYSIMIVAYTMLGIQSKMDSPRGQELLQIVDPYSYRDRLAMPKMIILGTNDPFWTVDSLNLYWDGLSGDKYVLYIPNKGHAAIDIPRLTSNITATMAMANGKVKFPKMTWEYQTAETGATLKVRTDKPAQRVWAFVTDRPSRDFSVAWWRHEPMQERDGAYVYELPTPEKGFMAMYGEGLFDLGNELSVYLCTQIKVIGAKSATTATSRSTAALTRP